MDRGTNFTTEKLECSEEDSQPAAADAIRVPGPSLLWYSDLLLSETRFQCARASSSST